MKLKHLFWFQAIISTINGLSAMFLTKTWLGMYGVYEMSATTLLFAQLLGAGIFNYALVAFLARDSHPSEARNAIVISFCVTNILGAVFTALGVAAGLASPMGWGAVFLYGILALGYGYFWLIKKD
jgi:hypothetical protein